MRTIEWEKLDILKDHSEIEDLDTNGLIDFVKLTSTNQLYFWVGHTNWRLTKRDLHILDDLIDGIEVLEQLTPYRFVFCCGKQFDIEQVKSTIVKTLCPIEFKLSDELILEIQTLQNNLLNNYSNWVIYVLPNNKIEYIYLDNNLAEFTQKYLELQEAEEKYGGMILIPTKNLT